MVKSSDQSKLPRRDGQSTREALVIAGLAVVHDLGYAGVTARNVADRAGVNSALVFYHFKSVDGLLLAGLDQASRHRLARYESAFAKVTTVADAIKTIRRLWKQDNAEHDITAIRELVASHSFASNHGDEITGALSPWLEFVERQVDLFVADNPLLQLIKPKDIAFAAVAFAMGAETLQGLMPTSKSMASLFTAGEQIASMYES